VEAEGFGSSLGFVGDSRFSISPPLEVEVALLWLAGLRTPSNDLLLVV